MKKISLKISKLKTQYDLGKVSNSSVKELTEYCLFKLNSKAKLYAHGKILNKEYFTYQQGGLYSRPLLKDLMLAPKIYSEKWDKFINSIDSKQITVHADSQEINSLLYTSLMAFSACYDLWMPGSRKTPGTYFEILLGTVIGKMLTNYKRTKYIPIPDQTTSVTTDIVFDNGKRGLIFPVKITTRERIVQPFAHQRIVNSVFGKDRYISVLLCASELQRAEDLKVNEICVPGTIKLFQMHLAKMAGIYYLDPPCRYLKEDILSIIKVDSIGIFLKEDLRKLITDEKVVVE